MGRALQSSVLRGELLDARVDIYTVNFGEASRHFETARSGVRAAKERLQWARATRRCQTIGTRLHSHRRGAAFDGPAQSGCER